MLSKPGYLDAAIQEAHGDFNKNPTDWTLSEANTRTKLFNILKKQIHGSIYIFDDNPFPEFKKQKSQRVHLEINLENRIRPDIVIYKDKEEFNSTRDYKLLSKVECFIEVKATWGYHKLHFCGKGVIKDFENLSIHEKGYFVYFIANRFADMKNENRNEYRIHISKYRNIHDRMYIVFRDIINPPALFR